VIYWQDLPEWPCPERRVSVSQRRWRSSAVAGMCALEIPQEISSAIGRRGPVPIVATLNRDVELQASLVPMGGGRLWLQLNGASAANWESSPAMRCACRSSC